MSALKPEPHVTYEDGWDKWVAIGTILLAVVTVFVPLIAKWFNSRAESSTQKKVVSSFLIELIKYMERHLVSHRQITNAFDKEHPPGEKPDVLKHFYSLLILSDYLKKMADTAFSFQENPIM